MMKCLTNIVGVTKDECECLIGGLDEAERIEVKKSTSGLYLDNLPGGVSLRGLDDADACNGMAKMSFQALEDAAMMLEESIKVALSNEYKSVPQFSGMIGQMSYANTMTISKRWQGQVLRASHNSDAILSISRAIFIVNKSGPSTFKILKVEHGAAMGTEVYSQDIELNGNNYVAIDIPDTYLGNPMKFPLLENGRPVDYYFLWDTSQIQDVLPKDNKLDCGCSKAVTDSMTRYVKPIGIEVESLNNVTDSVATNRAHGILIDVTIKCNNAQLICREYDSNEAIAVVMAYCIYFKAGELLIEAVLKSPEVNRYTQMSREYLYGKRNHFRKEYDDRMIYLGESIDASSSSCFICKDNSMGKDAIIVTDYNSVRNYDLNNSYSRAGINATKNH